MTHLVLILLVWLALTPLDPAPAVTHDNLKLAWNCGESASDSDDDGDLGPGIDPDG